MTRDPPVTGALALAAVAAASAPDEPARPTAASANATDVAARAWGAGVGLVALALYLVTLCPTVYTRDAPELTVVAATWGVAHPPGYALFTMLYGSVLHLVPFGDVALRANVVTAVVAAATVSVLFLAGRRLGASLPAAGAGALGIAVARDWWSQAVATEVYALDGLLLACALLATIRVVRDPRALRGWIWLGIAFGLSCGHRPVNVLFLLALLVWADVARRRAGGSASGLVRFVAAGLATALVWLYLPIAAAADPPYNMGDPSDPGRLWIVLTAAPFARHLASTDVASSLVRLAHYGVSIPAQLGLTGLAALIGWWGLPPGRGAGRAAAWALAAFALLNLLFVVVYNVPDGESFLQPTWTAAAVLAACGYDVVRRRIVKGATSVLLLAALLPVAWAYPRVDLSSVRTVERYGRDLLASANPGAMVITYGDTARNAMLYQQVARGQRPDVAIVEGTAPLAWHLDEIRTRSPDFDTMGVEGDGWIEALAQRMVRDPRRAVYLTDIEGIDLDVLLGPDASTRFSMVPTGLLYRLVPTDPRGASPPDIGAIAAAADRAFWPGREIEATSRAYQDPELAAVAIRSAQPRFLLAVTYVLSGRTDAALPHLESLAESDIDALEDVVQDGMGLSNFLPERWSIGVRSRRGADAIRSGASREDVSQALAPR